MEAYVKGTRIILDPAKSIGKGAEADVFDIGNGKALKLFKTPNHPDLRGLPDEQLAAQMRLAIYQKKLRLFPGNLPPQVVSPEELATDKAGRMIRGYSMTLVAGAEVLLHFSERPFRQGHISNGAVIEIFRSLHATLNGIHRAGAVIGDFNDLNVLVRGSEAYIIDADSFQFGNFPCTMFTSRFLDPLLCDAATAVPELVRPYVPDSDWYAYAIMLMQCLLYVHPYGGIYRPKDRSARIRHDTRPLHRITVFHPDVAYPKPAVPYSTLTDDLLQYFHLVFEKDGRGQFPHRLLESLEWNICPQCGMEHARAFCPICSHALPLVVREVVTVRGRVTAERVFATSGRIVYAAYQQGRMRWLVHENGAYRREDASVVFRGSGDRAMRFRISGPRTLVAKNGQMLVLAGGNIIDRVSVDSVGLLPTVGANEQYYYWISGGQLLRNGQWAPEYIGDVLAGQTLFWVGLRFGFGYYRAGNLAVAFVFSAFTRGVNDSVPTPPISGQLVDVTCVFADDYCWFFTSVQEKGGIINTCRVVDSSGCVIATGQAQKGDGSWLAEIRGKCAAGNFILTPTDEGVVRSDIEQGGIVTTKTFPDMEPFVDAGSLLFAGGDGLYVVNPQEIYRLTMR